MRITKTAWDDFFEGSVSPTLFSKRYTANQTFLDTNVYVLNCLFTRCTSPSSGGALYCKSMKCLLIESSSFFSCKASGNNGGAVYFFNSGEGQSVFYKVCGNDCNLDYNSTGNCLGQFVYTYVNNSGLAKNHFNYSSIARCVSENSNSWHTLSLYKGRIFSPSINISMNRCASRSVFFIHPYFDTDFISCSTSYSSFVDNNATLYTCLVLYAYNSKSEIICCNILRNTQVNDTTEGIVRSRGEMTIKDSCILENSGGYIFYTDSLSSITLFNCTVDNTTNNGNLTLQSIAMSRFIHKLDHLSTELCSAEYDSVGPVCKNIIIHYSCKRFFCQPHLSDVFKIISIFIFNFIHPNTTVYS
jgi:hypothetical protein